MHQLYWFPQGLYLGVSPTAADQSQGKDKQHRVWKCWIFCLFLHDRHGLVFQGFIALPGLARSLHCSMLGLSSILPTTLHSRGSLELELPSLPETPSLIPNPWVTSSLQTSPFNFHFSFAYDFLSISIGCFLLYTIQPQSCWSRRERCYWFQQQMEWCEDTT